MTKEITLYELVFAFAMSVIISVIIFIFFWRLEPEEWDIP